MNNLPNNTEVKIVIADDHPIFRRGLKSTIEVESDLQIVAEATDGATALARICEYEPDVAVLDVDMPKMNGLEVVRQIQKRNLTVEIIFLTMHDSKAIFNTALDLSVKGYVLKDSAMNEIIHCIKAVCCGRNYISPQLSTLLVSRGNEAAAILQNQPWLDDLTLAERRILKLIAADKTSRQIANELFISIRTVERHRANICDKLNLYGTNALIKFAGAHKFELA